MISNDSVVGRPAWGTPAGRKSASRYVLAAATVGVERPEEEPPHAVNEIAAAQTVSKASEREARGRPSTSESFLEPVTRMRWNEAPELEHDLRVPQQRDRTRITTPDVPVHPGTDALDADGAETDQPTPAERLPPNREELSECRRNARDELDYPGRLSGPDRVRAPTGGLQRVQAQGWRDPDTRWDEHDPATSEQLEMSADTPRVAARAGEPGDHTTRAEQRPTRPRVELRSMPDGGRHNGV